jgi:hypothetical protein
MSTVKVIDIIQRVESILQDSGVRWPRIELQTWINEAYLNIVLLRPDANAKTGTFTCAAGTRQTLDSVFTSAISLLDITRNVAATSAKKVVRLVSRSTLDDQLSEWHAETPTVDIQHYTFDPRHPKQFYVYPPATAAAELEVIYTDTPGSHALTATQLDPANGDPTVILLDDIYMSPIIDWVLYRAYAKDAESAANEARAAAAFQAFSGAIGSKTQVDAAVTPQG